jgi:hypothetical protein
MNTQDKTKSKNLFQKLIEVKRKVRYLQKDTAGFGYKYASGTSVLTAINEILNDEGVILKSEIVGSSYEPINVSVFDKKTNAYRDKTEFLYSMIMLMTWVNVDDPQDRDENKWCAFGCNGEEKGYGSALTYGERYFMLKYFSIPTDEDDPDKVFKDRNNGQDHGAVPGNGTEQPKGGKRTFVAPGQGQAVIPGQVSEAYKKLANDYDVLYTKNLPILNPQQVQNFCRKANWTLENLTKAQQSLKAIEVKKKAEIDALAESLDKDSAINK